MRDKVDFAALLVESFAEPATNRGSPALALNVIIPSLAMIHLRLMSRSAIPQFSGWRGDAPSK